MQYVTFYAIVYRSDNISSSKMKNSALLQHNRMDSDTQGKGFNSATASDDPCPCLNQDGSYLPVVALDNH